MKATDEQLLEAARSGDQSALEALLVRHQDRVYRFGMKLCRDEDDAKDVLQDSLFAMARSIRDFRGKSSLSTWLFTIARSFCIKKRRRSKFAPAHESSLERDVPKEAKRLEDPGPGPEEELAGKEIREALEASILAMEPEYREVLILRDIEGLTAPEVAEITELSVAAVKSRLHRARLKLRELIAPKLKVGESKAHANCPDVLTLYSKHLEDEISADVCVRMEKHLEGCSHCRTTCDSLKETLAMCQESPRTQVPAAVQDSVRTALRELLAHEKN